MTRGKSSERFWHGRHATHGGSAAPSLSPRQERRRPAPAAADGELVEDLRAITRAWRERLASRSDPADLAAATRVAEFLIGAARDSSRTGTAVSFLRPARLVTLTEAAGSNDGATSRTLARWAESGSVAGRKFRLKGQAGETWIVDLNDVERMLRERER